jgi:hypothetical protein
MSYTLEKITFWIAPVVGVMVGYDLWKGNPLSITQKLILTSALIVLTLSYTNPEIYQEIYPKPIEKTERLVVIDGKIKKV